MHILGLLTKAQMSSPVSRDQTLHVMAAGPHLRQFQISISGQAVVQFTPCSVLMQGFRGLADPLASLPVVSNQTWRPAAMLENFKCPYLSNGSPRVGFLGRQIEWPWWGRPIIAWGSHSHRQGRRSLWDRGDTSPQYWDCGDMITNVPLNISRVISATFYPCNIFLIS